MKIEEFIKKLRECKKSAVYTGTSKFKLKVKRISDGVTIYEESNKICRYCGTDLSKTLKGVEVLFFKEQKPLSIFQAYLLYMVYVLNKIPSDYANYHKCIAGKEFIENIKQIKVLK